jgi:hypothetical protein
MWQRVGCRSGIQPEWISCIAGAGILGYLVDEGYLGGYLGHPRNLPKFMGILFYAPPTPSYLPALTSGSKNMIGPISSKQSAVPPVIGQSTQYIRLIVRWIRWLLTTMPV